MLKKILYNFSVYSVSTVICAILNVLILPVLTANLSEKDYGTTALFSTFVMIVSPIIGISSEGFFWVEYFKREGRATELTRLFSTHFWMSLVNTMFISVLIIAAWPLISDSAFFSLAFLLMIPASGFMSLVGEETRNYFVNRKMPMAYLFYSVALTVVDLGLSWYLIVNVFHNWEGRILGWITSLTLQFLVSVFFFGVKLKFLTFRFSRQDLRTLFVFGFPLIFHQLGKFVINQSDRIFISEMVSLEEAGIYTIGYQVGSMLLLPIGAFSNFYTPFVYEKLASGTDNDKREIVKMCYIFALLIVVFFFLIILVAPLFFTIFIHPKFNNGLNYVGWVALSYVFWGFYLQIAAVIFYRSKTSFLGWLSLANIVLNALFNYFFIQNFGAIGAAYATALSFFIVFVATFFFSNKLTPLPWLRITGTQN